MSTSIRRSPAPPAAPARRARRAVALVATTCAALLLGAATLSAHDFWIVPTAFAVAAGDAIEIEGRTSTNFPSSLSAVAPERVAEARVIGSASDERVSEMSTREKSLVLRHRPSAPGQRVVAVALASRAARTTPARLERYIALEGAPELAARYRQDGAYPQADSLTQTTAKYAKTVVEIGARGPRAFTRLAGHPLELVPVNDPAALRPGDTLRVRVLYRGRPLAGAHLHAGVAARDSAHAAAKKDLSITTGADGVARVPLAEGGLWNVRTLHGAPVAEGGADWEVLFATLVFGVQERQQPGRRAR